ncbi:choice-of-anchor D domain-containing protein [Archangium sp.]|jgi:hypothetical protein|uniref:choice-of-anchor D domain-containing protein n=1 Tax=Archangium sp. TaxID=1872627 RepID=UPI002EDA1B00
MAELRWASVAVCLLTVVAVGCEAREPSKLSVLPRDLEFNPSPIGVARVEKVFLVNEGGEPLTIHGATATASSLEVPSFEPFTLEAGATRNLEVRFTPDVEGPVRVELEVRTDASNVGPEGVLRVKVSGQGVRPLLEVRTASIDFGTQALGEVREGTLLVHNLMGTDSRVRLEFAGADADQFSSSEASAPRVLSPGEVRALPVFFEPKRLGAAQALARISVCPGCEPLDVPLSGQAIASWLEVTPSRVDFGRVERGNFAEASFTVRNLGSKPLAYGGVKLLDNASGAFFVVKEPTLPDGRLAPGEVMELKLGFSPTTRGPVHEARLELDARPVGTTQPGLQVPLAGEGGAACVEPQTRALDFGLVAEGMSVTREVRLLNRCRTHVLLSGPTLTPRSGGDFLLTHAPASLSIPAGLSASVPVTFQPRTSGASEAGLTLQLHNGHSSFTEEVRVTGTGKVFSPCQYNVEPATVDFGSVPVDAEVTLSAAVRNIGATECYLAGMQLVEGSDATFAADEPGNTVLAPGQRAALLVRFKPSAEGEFSGLAEGRVNHPSNGHVLIPLRGRGVRGCFSVQPTHLDFGVTRLACGPKSRELVVHNKCPGPTTLTGMGLEGDLSDFKLTHGLLFPAVLGPNSETRIQVTYEPRSDGDDTAAFRFDLGTGSPYTVGVLGRGVLKNEQTDEFIRSTKTQVDVLFVVDNSGSMQDEQQLLGENFAAFLSPMSLEGVDYHIAVTTTGVERSSGGWAVCPGGAEGGENGRFFPVDGSSPRIITPSTPSAASVFAYNTRVGVCHWNEMGLEAMYRALSEPLVFNEDDPRTPLAHDGNAHFLRQDASLAVIVVTDEEDFSPQPVSFYETFLEGLKGGDASKVVFSAIAGPKDLGSCPKASSSGHRYIQLAEATGGVVESICTPHWADSLKRTAERISASTRGFPLSERPLDTSRIEVRVDGVEVKTGWTYDGATHSILFQKGAVPAPGSHVRVTYPVDC